LADVFRIGEDNGSARQLLRILGSVCLTLLLINPSWCADALPKADEIVRRSVANTDADWAKAAQYDFTERDIVVEHGTRTAKTYQVMMIEGSPYNKLIARNGEPLSAAETRQQDQKLAAETNRRRKESSEARQKRVGAYQRERRQDHALMSEMAKAFDFKLTGQDTVNGHRCFVLEAEPKAGYRPSNHETAVLTGMRGTMWVDAQAYQWVKVHAEVFRPVAFGLFFARVNPGTQFTLEEQPVHGDLWLPSHFAMAVKARILIASRNSTDDETYSNYRPSAPPPCFFLFFFLGVVN
jgi:hypothetical protein